MRKDVWKVVLPTVVVLLLATSVVTGVTKSEIRKQMEGVKKAYQRGLMTEERYKQKLAYLEEALKTAPEGEPPVKDENVRINMIQNGSFEDFNPNTGKWRSRWMWWNGWKWGGDYVNNKAGDAKDGKLCAEIKCTGRKGRIGLFTPEFPILKKDAEYELTLWIKGTPGNRLNVAFEGDARGNGAFTGGPEWKKVTVIGKAKPKGTKFRVYFYMVGTGTLWIDDVQMYMK